MTLRCSHDIRGTEEFSRKIRLPLKRDLTIYTVVAASQQVIYSGVSAKYSFFVAVGAWKKEGFRVARSLKSSDL